MKDIILEIAENYLNEIEINSHLHCEIITRGLSIRLKESGIDNDIVIFNIESKQYNGEKLDFDVIEHYCIKIGNKILDASASQFNKPNGEKMPCIYFGSRLIWYK